MELIFEANGSPSLRAKQYYSNNSIFNIIFHTYSGHDFPQKLRFPSQTTYFARGFYTAILYVDGEMVFKHADIVIVLDNRLALVTEYFRRGRYRWRPESVTRALDKCVEG